MHTLAAELANEASPVFVRNAAGLALKNALTARVRRAFPSPLPPPFPSPLLPSRSSPVLPPPSAHAPYTGSHRTARARRSTRPAGSLSMARSATRSKSLSCAGFTPNRSRPAPSPRRASRLSRPWSFLRASGQISSRYSCALLTVARVCPYDSRRLARSGSSARCWCVSLCFLGTIALDPLFRRFLFLGP